MSSATGDYRAVTTEENLALSRAVLIKEQVQYTIELLNNLLEVEQLSEDAVIATCDQRDRLFHLVNNTEKDDD